jgi:hypothetical protein
MLKRFLLLIILSANIFASNISSVPLDNPIYPFFDRLETMRLIDELLMGTKPISRDRVATILLHLDSTRLEMTSIDKQKLNNFLLDYRYEIDSKNKYEELPEGQNWYTVLQPSQFVNDFSRILKQNNPEEENHVFLWEDEENNLYFDHVLNITYDKNSEDNYRLANSTLYKFRGLIASNLAYSLNIELVGVQGDRPYRDNDPILKGSWRQTTEDDAKIFFDRSGGELALNTQYVDLRFAMQPVSWGWGESGKLILSDYVEQFPYISISKNWGWGSFTFLHGKLLATKDSVSADLYSFYPDKWVAAQRFEFSPWNPLTIGLNETFIYGNRYADWAYLIPFNFYRAVQHNLKDRDNATISIDAQWVARPGIKLYGTVFLDEMSQSKLGTNWYGNKHAFLFGTHFTDPLNIQNLSLRFEYVAVMPWVYTHKFNVNRYINDLRPLGYWAGPNSEVYYMKIYKEWHHRFLTGIKYRQWKHGANYKNENIGGDVLVGHNTLLGTQQEARQTREFLEGILTTEKQFEFYSQYEILNDLYLNFSYINTRTNLSGSTTKLTEYHFGFKLDY